MKITGFLSGFENHFTPTKKHSMFRMTQHDRRWFMFPHSACFTQIFCTTIHLSNPKLTEGPLPKDKQICTVFVIVDCMAALLCLFSSKQGK